MGMNAPSSCKELRKVRELLDETATTAASWCGTDPGSADHAALSSALQMARLGCEAALRAIEVHQTAHGCGEEDLAIEVVRLFNVGSEHWEQVETAVHGHPPKGALGYHPAETPEGTYWIVDRSDLQEKLRAGAALRYTEAGLNILREEGLEM